MSYDRQRCRSETLVDPRPEPQDHTRLIVEAIPDAIVDRAGVMTDVNRHLVTLTGRTRIDLLGMPLRQVFEEQVLTESCVHQAFELGSVSNCELTAIRASVTAATA